MAAAHCISPLDDATLGDAWPSHTMVMYYSSIRQCWACATIVRYNQKWYSYDLKVLWSEDFTITEVNYVKAKLMRARACRVDGEKLDGENQKHTEPRHDDRFPTHESDSQHWADNSYGEILSSTSTDAVSVDGESSHSGPQSHNKRKRNSWKGSKTSGIQAAYRDNRGSYAD